MRRLLAIAVAVVLVAGCSGRGGEDPPPSAVVRVFAASSLAGPFQDLGVKFARQRDGVRVDFTFSSSDVLVDEVARGRAAAVLATADPSLMADAVEDGLARGSSVFARNYLAIVVPAGNPAGIAGFGDLRDPDVQLAMCAESRTCGALARSALDKAGVDRDADISRQTASAVLDLVAAGDADAGIVFATTPSAEDDDEVDVVLTLDRNDADLEAVYEIALLSTAIARDEAQAWVEFVLGNEGQAVLAEHGFARP
jgi:molybdate transport system substrate-binding protein